MSSIFQSSFHARRFSRIALFIALVAACLVPAAWADPVGPRPEDRQITLGVRTLLLQEHLSRHPLDKEIAARWMKTFLKSLDPMKVYFYQSDVDEFTRHQDDLIKMIEKNDISFAYFVFQRYLQRVDERVKMVDELLAQPHGLHGQRGDDRRPRPAPISQGPQRSPRALAKAPEVRCAGPENGQGKEDRRFGTRQRSHPRPGR